MAQDLLLVLIIVLLVFDHIDGYYLDHEKRPTFPFEMN